jgi:hypothetical protein
LTEALDDLFVLWQREVTNPVIDEMANQLDGVLLRGWAIQDNVALLVSNWFEVGLDRPKQVSLHERVWRQSVRDHSAEGERVIASMESWRQLLRGSEPLRHHAVHRERLGPIRVQSGDDDPDARIFLPATVSSALRQDLRSAGADPGQWGLGEQIVAHNVHHSVDHGSGLVEEFDELDPGGAFLDPVPFSAQFVAAVAGLANAAFESLDPASDARLPDAFRVLARTPPDEKWATPEFAWKSILASPLSGLVPWADPSG